MKSSFYLLGNHGDVSYYLSENFGISIRRERKSDSLVGFFPELFEHIARTSSAAGAAWLTRGGLWVLKGACPLDQSFFCASHLLSMLEVFWKQCAVIKKQGVASLLFYVMLNFSYLMPIRGFWCDVPLLETPENCKKKNKHCLAKMNAGSATTWLLCGVHSIGCSQWVMTLLWTRTLSLLPSLLFPSWGRNQSISIRTSADGTYSVQPVWQPADLFWLS